MLGQDKSRIQIGWSDPLNQGGTTLQNYLVEMDSGRLRQPGVFKTMSIQLNQATDSFSTASFLDADGNTQNLATGDIYQFRVTARNIVGDS